MDPKFVESIIGEVIVKNSAGVKFSDVSGQDKAKSALRKILFICTVLLADVDWISSMNREKNFLFYLPIK